jgi:hypothetical protein
VSKLIFPQFDVTQLEDRVIELLPGEIVAKVKEWEKTAAARVYVMAVWAEPDGTPTGFE